MANTHVMNLVVDSGAFIKDANIQSIGDKIWSISEVVNEIKDKATIQRLQVLPYEIEFRTPSTDCVKTVTEFSKRTGDYPTLSATDIKVLALTYQLEKEHRGTDHLRLTPSNQIHVKSTKQRLDKLSDIAGFYLKAEKKDGVNGTSGAENADEIVSTHIVLSELSLDDAETNISRLHSNVLEHNDGDNELKEKSRELPDIGEVGEPATINQWKNCPAELSDDADLLEKNVITETSDIRNVKPDDNRIHSVIPRDGDTLADDLLDENGDDNDSDTLADDMLDENGDDNNGGGWITPGNIDRIKQSIGVSDRDESKVAVACLTTDFAMQNVLIQMGLNVVAIDGMLIKRAKNHVLRCFACRRITTDMTKQFCFNCGNKTLRRITMSISADGVVRYFFSRRKPPSTRGMKYNIPTPKGGKHGNNEQLFEDQRMPQQRPSKKSLARANILDMDYVAGTSPFILHDTTSRAARLGIVRGRRTRGANRHK